MLIARSCLLRGRAALSLARNSRSISIAGRAQSVGLIRSTFRPCLDTYILHRVYTESGLAIRNHCGAQPPRDIEPVGLLGTVGRRDRASTSYVAADCVKAPARVARRRVRRILGRCAAPSLPPEAWTTSRAGCVA